MDTIEIASVKPAITYDTFNKVDIRIGTIVRVEDIPDAKTLVRLIVDFGDHERRIIAGIKQERRIPGRSRESRPCSL